MSNGVRRAWPVLTMVAIGFTIVSLLARLGSVVVVAIDYRLVGQLPPSPTEADLEQLRLAHSGFVTLSLWWELIALATWALFLLSIIVWSRATAKLVTALGERPREALRHWTAYAGNALLLATAVFVCWGGVPFASDLDSRRDLARTDLWNMAINCLIAVALGLLLASMLVRRRIVIALLADPAKQLPAVSAMPDPQKTKEAAAAYANWREERRF